jgi:hypothetical protein
LPGPERRAITRSNKHTTQIQGETMRKYEIVNDYDPNERFEVEADGTEEAAFAGLNALGWHVAQPSDEDSE